VETGGRETEHSGSDARAESNVVPFPRDWLGPRDELVPFGADVRFGADASPSPNAPFASDERPRTGARTSDLALPSSAEAFWSETSAEIQDALQGPVREQPAAGTSPSPRRGNREGAGRTTKTGRPRSGWMSRRWRGAHNTRFSPGAWRRAARSAVVRPVVRPARSGSAEGSRRGAQVRPLIGAGVLASVCAIAIVLAAGFHPSPARRSVTSASAASHARMSQTNFPPILAAVARRHLTTVRASGSRRLLGERVRPHSSRTTSHRSRAAQLAPASASGSAEPVTYTQPTAPSALSAQDQSSSSAGASSGAGAGSTSSSSPAPGPVGLGAPFGPGHLG
jgi:hypothetical protein